jgi:RNA polymerase sigma-70 factor (sigma-E family)
MPVRYVGLGVGHLTGGDDEDFRSYALSRQRALRRAAFLMCGDWYQADDFVQATLTRLYAAWHRITAEQGPDAYAHRILANVVIDERRRPWRREVSVEEIFDREDPNPAPNPAERLDLIDALARLPRGQRMTLVLRFWLDVSVTGTAEAMGCSPSTVKRQTTKGLNHLRLLLALDDPLVTANEEFQ